MRIVTSREDYLEKYFAMHQQRIVRCYEKEWSRYVELCKRFMRESPIQKVKFLLLDHIESIPSNLTDKLTMDGRIEFSSFLFKSLIMCVMDTENAKPGVKISHHLPLSFRIFLDPNRVKEFKLVDPREANAQFNKIVSISEKAIKNYLKPFDFSCSVTDTAITCSPSERYSYFTINIIMNRYINKSELLIAGRRSIETLMLAYKLNNVNDFSREDGEKVLTPGAYFVQKHTETPLLEFVKTEHIGVIDDWLRKVREEADIFKAKCEEILRPYLTPNDEVCVDLALNVNPKDTYKLYVTICTRVPSSVYTDNPDEDGINVIRFDRKPEELQKAMYEIMNSLRNTTLEHSGIQIMDPDFPEMKCVTENDQTACTVSFDIRYPDYIQAVLDADEA